MPRDDDTGTSTRNEKSQSTKSYTSPKFAQGSKTPSVRDAQSESIMDTVTSPTEILESIESKIFCCSAIVNNKLNIIVSIVSIYKTTDYQNYIYCFPRTQAR